MQICSLSGSDSFLLMERIGQSLAADAGISVNAATPRAYCRIKRINPSSHSILILPHEKKE
jgi:hypothetical protein